MRSGPGRFPAADALAHAAASNRRGRCSLAGIIGAGVIASWSYGLIRGTGAILLDMRPDREIEQNTRRTIENESDRLTDLHVWRLGPGHLGAIVSVATRRTRSPGFYRERLAQFRSLSHITAEVQRTA